jgi:hypothetical protein
LPNIALLQETPSSTAINPSASPTSLAINENVFEVGPIRDLLVKIKREFAKGRNWGLKPAVFHEMGVVTYSLLLYEKSDIAETEVFRLLLAIPWGILLVFSLSYGPEFILEFMPEFIVKFIPGFIPGFILEFILHLSFTTSPGSPSSSSTPCPPSSPSATPWTPSPNYSTCISYLY